MREQHAAPGQIAGPGEGRQQGCRRRRRGAGQAQTPLILRPGFGSSIRRAAARGTRLTRNCGSSGARATAASCAATASPWRPAIFSIIPRLDQPAAGPGSSPTVRRNCAVAAWMSPASARPARPSDARRRSRRDRRARPARQRVARFQQVLRQAPAQRRVPGREVQRGMVLRRGQVRPAQAAKQGGEVMAGMGMAGPGAGHLVQQPRGLRAPRPAPRGRGRAAGEPRRPPDRPQAAPGRAAARRRTGRSRVRRKPRRAGGDATGSWAHRAAARRRMGRTG